MSRSIIEQAIINGCDNAAEFIIDRLPTGSGINCQWQFKEQKTSALVFFNSFHCMNEHGYYDGWADFRIKLYPSENILDFKLEFNGKQAQYKNRQYMLRDYLEETIYHHMREYIGSEYTLADIIAAFNNTEE